MRPRWIIEWKFLAGDPWYAKVEPNFFLPSRNTSVNYDTHNLTTLSWKNGSLIKKKLLLGADAISNKVHVSPGYGILYNLVYSLRSSVMMLLVSDLVTASIVNGFVKIQCNSFHVNSGSEVFTCITSRLLGFLGDLLSPRLTCYQNYFLTVKSLSFGMDLIWFRRSSKRCDFVPGSKKHGGNGLQHSLFWLSVAARTKSDKRNTQTARLTCCPNKIISKTICL